MMAKIGVPIDKEVGDMGITPSSINGVTNVRLMLIREHSHLMSGLPELGIMVGALIRGWQPVTGELFIQDLYARDYMPSSIGIDDGDTVMNKVVVDTANCHPVSTCPFALVEP